ncbi:hypothetical protein [Agrobacterium rubi]|uniref:Succinoglycan biosynthesis protein exop n=1 Tax=Agrobacterium rubi TaxID=28099 RepID=A0AAE7UR21_9HYPH|nr:hypothetical protein [Agrobacterium rubi]NTE85431.1 hypothetical protein [Agrobacterium rubi]NTF01363.1 hypothetical protein [Agrobacterium rubi]NTF35606.1 hypothetical protein [Agrobacterium rubi]OCJ48468.1 hypothetical protein A6U92_09925 [Agrobacterium rubi]QTG00731.1 hypothetical protein G6M88_10145 [Agrobacterium rubi]
MVFENDRHVSPRGDELPARGVTSSWRRHLLSAGVVLSLTTGGFFLPGLLLDPGLKGYVSQASVKVSDPRANAASVQRIAAQVRDTLMSPISLGLTVSELKLQPQDLTGVETPGHLSVLLDLLGGGKSGEALVGATETALKDAVTISSAPSDEEIDVAVTAATPQAAQKITDHMATLVIKQIGVEQQAPELQAVEKARVALDSAEAALTGFQMRHGNDAVSRIQSLQQKLREDDALSADLHGKSTELADAISTASAMKVDDVLNRTLPPLSIFAPLEPIRDSYATAKLALAEISVDYGPKHPKTIAAQASVDAARAAAMPTMRRVLETLKREQATVTAALDSQASGRAELDNQLQAMGQAPADLARLETALEKARTDYILSSEAAGTFSAKPRVSAKLIKEAEAGVANYDAFTATAMALAGAAAGLLLSLFVLSFRRSESEEEHGLLQTPESEVPVVDVAPEQPPVAETVEIEPGIFDDLETAEEQAEISEDVAESVDIAAQAETVVETEAELEPVHDEPANDVPLDQRVRQVLLSNAVHVATEERDVPTFKLPPLLAAALAGKAHHAQAETEELRALRQELVILREQLSEHAARQNNRSNQA